MSLQRIAPGEAADPLTGWLQGVAVPTEGLGEGRASGPAGPLDQKRENRKTPVEDPRAWRERVPVGDFVAIPARAGGSFDKLGVRAGDVRRADDVVALVKGHPGRWLTIALTVDRASFLWADDDENGPAVAYEACNERVRKVAAAVSVEGVWVAALELQGKTGDGWPHWHLIVWCPDGRSVDELRAAVLDAWRFKAQRIDEETGAIVEERGAPIARPHCVRVEEAADREGISVYCAKYLMKQWPALPAWMLNSRRQLRKLRLSRGAFKWLAAQGRHVIHRGGRCPSKTRRRRARTLLERMSWSGAAHGIFRMNADRSLSFVKMLTVPADDAGAQALLLAGGVPVKFGTFARCRVHLTDAGVAQLEKRRDHLARISRQYRQRLRENISTAWDWMQHDRAERERKSEG